MHQRQTHPGQPLREDLRRHDVRVALRQGWAVQLLRREGHNGGVRQVQQNIRRVFQRPVDRFDQARARTAGEVGDALRGEVPGGWQGDGRG